MSVNGSQLRMVASRSELLVPLRISWRRNAEAVARDDSDVAWNFHQKTTRSDSSAISSVPS